MRILTAIMATLASLTYSLGIAQAVSAPAHDHRAMVHLDPMSADRLDPIPADTPIVFRHGDVSWLPALALKAGWTADQIPKLTEIVLRESGGCPNRRGGDMVDKNCNLTGVSEWNHRSDTSLLQINGQNFDPTRNPTAPICLQMKICTQEPLFDPLTNLKAGKLLYDYWEKAAGNGWIPWDPCNRTRTCKASTKSLP
jgi:hypothetical protein